LEPEEEVVQGDEIKEDELEKKEKWFGYSMMWIDIIPMLGTEPLDLHQTKEIWYPLVTCEFAAKKVFKYLTQEIKPVAKELDGSKFTKFIKGLPDVVDGKKIKTTDIDIIFAKAKEKDQRRLKFKEFFNIALVSIAELRYPWVEKCGELGGEGPACREFIRKHIFKWDVCADLVWQEARRLAIVAEAKLYLASKRLQSNYRAMVDYKYYQKQQKAAKLMQEWIRTVLIRMRFLHQIGELRKMKAKERLQKMEERRAFRESRVFQEARSIDGILNVVSVFRHSKRDIFLMVYNPENGEKFQFNMRKTVLREFLERSLNSGSLSANELFIKSNMRLLSDQLMYRSRMDPKTGERIKVLVLSEKGGGERGKLCARKGKMVNGKGCIVSVYQYFKDFIFKAHDVETCEMMRTTLSDTQLKRWFQWTEDQPIPPLLRIENRSQLIAWFLERVFICSGCGLTSHRMAHAQGRNVSIDIRGV